MTSSLQSQKNTQINNYGLSVDKNTRKQTFESTKFHGAVLAIQKQALDRLEGLLERGKEQVKGLQIVEGYMVGVGALNLLIHHFRKRKNDYTLNAYVCRDLESLRESLERIEKTHFVGKVAFLVNSMMDRKVIKTFSHPDRWSSRLHFTSVLVEATQNRINLFVMDSVSSLDGKTYSLKSQEVPIIRHGKYQANVIAQIAKANLKRLSVYTTNVSRQADDCSCSTFALEDARAFSKLSDFFLQIENSGQLIPCDDKREIRYAQLLPPPFMKITQSITKLKEYLKVNFSSKNSKLYDVHPLKETVNKTIRRKEGTNRKLNMAAEKKHITYLEILSDYLKTKSFSELEKLTKQYDSSKFLNQS